MNRLPEKIRRRTRMLANGCWEWTGGKNDLGYGYVRVNGTHQRVHRVVYEAAAAPIPEGMVLDHTCRNRACVNPDHLEVVTGAENTLRGFGAPAVNARKTHCVRGHKFSPANTYVNPRGQRQCRVCNAMRTAAYRSRLNDGMVSDAA